MTGWIIGAVLLIAGAGVPLGFCVETVHPGTDPFVEQLLDDAAER